MAKGLPQDTEIGYCYPCFQWHVIGEHRPIVKLPACILVGILKIWWYGWGAVGTVLGWGVLVLFAIIGFMLVYAMIASLFKA